MSDNKKNFFLFLALFIIITLFLSVYPSSASLFSRKIYGASGTEFLYSEYTSANGTIRFNDLEQTSDEGYIIGGEIGPNPVDRTDPFVMKLDQYGDVVWQKRFHNAQGGSARDILQTSVGEYVVAGDYFATASETFMWVMKLDVSGNVVWNIELARKDVDTEISIQQTSDDGFIIASTAHYVTDESMLIRLDNNGNVLWVTRYLGSEDNYLHSAILADDGGFIAVGTFDTEIWLVRTNASGAVQWQKTYLGDFSLYLNGDSISHTSDGGFIVGGKFKPTSNDLFPLLMKVNSDGVVEWSKILFGDYRLNSVNPTNDGYIIAGTTYRYPNGWNLFIAKLDAQGNEIWMKTVGEDVYPVIRSAIQTNDGNFAAVGYASQDYVSPNKAIFTRIDSSGNIPGCSLLEDGELNISNVTVSVTNSNVNLPIQNFNTQSLSFVTTATSLQDELVCSSGTIPPDPCDDMSDDDGDALPNGWEICGYDHEGDGIIDVNLPAMGAHPEIPDIYVEIDYMVNESHSHRPIPNAISRVVQVFAQHGIRLHVDYGPDAPISYGSPDTWGKLSNAEELQHQVQLQHPSIPWDNPDDWPGFDAIKVNQHHFQPARWPIFHYAIFAHSLGGQLGNEPLHPRTSGLSRNLTGSISEFQQGASDFVVSLGEWDGAVGTEIQQAGTFMHELGHNLGLTHGGDDSQNFEPNYLSVMNYLFQTNGLVFDDEDGHLDYSNFEGIPDLHESALNESIGLSGGSQLENFGTRYYCSPTNNRVVDANSGIDWNCSGIVFGTVEANINDGDPDNPSEPNEILTGYRDWSNLVFSGGLIRDSPNLNLTHTTQVYGEPVVLEELNYDLASQLYVPYAIAIGPSNDLIIVSPGDNLTVPITLTNTGALTATVTFGDTSEAHWFDFSSLPTSITLPPDEQVVFYIELNVPVDVETGDRDSALLMAVLNESNLMSDSKTFKATVGPKAWFEVDSAVGLVPLTVTFQDLSIGQINSWHWNFGDGSTSTLQEVSHTYETPGKYTVSLTVTGPEGTNTYTRTNLIQAISYMVYLPIARK